MADFPCPNCKATLTPPVSQCSACGHVLVDLGAYASELLTDLKSVKRSIGDDLERLEERLTMLESLAAPQKPKEITPEPEAQASETPIEPAAPTQEAPPPPPPKAEKRPPASQPMTQREKTDAEIRFGQKWLLIAGVVTALLSIALFLKWSFDNNHIPPAARVLMAYLAGVGGLWGGSRAYKRKADQFGLYIQGGGVAALYFATFAAFHIYGLIGQPLAFGLMVLVTATAGLAAAVYDSKEMAVLGLIGGFMTPILLSTGSANQIALMSYMIVLNGGVLGLAYLKRWRLLTGLGFLFTWGIFTGWAVDHYDDDAFWTTTFFLNAFFAIYAVAPFLSSIFRKSPDLHKGGFLVTIPNAIIAFSYSTLLIADYADIVWASVPTVGYAMLYFAMANLVYANRSGTPDTNAFVILLAKGMIFLSIAVPILFDAYLVTDFWMILGVGLLWVSRKLDHHALMGGALALMALALGKFYLYDYSEVYSVWRFTETLPSRWLSTVLLLGALPLAARFYPADDIGRSVFGIAGLAALFFTLNFEVSAAFNEYLSNARFAAISVLWAIYSIALMMLGFLKRASLLRKISVFLFGATVLKVFFSDMANTSTPYRILSFLILGVLLIGASYLYYRFKDALSEDASPTEKAE